MDKLRAMALFVRLADAGSFTLVSEQTGYSKSMVSKEISRLEAELGARLLQRSTRRVQLTSVGGIYLQKAREILASMEEADNVAHDMQSKPKGKLRITAPMALGLTHLSPMFSAFMQTYPDIELDIHLGDEPLDLLEHGFDIGFRASSRPIDSGYVGRALLSFQYRVCVGPNYVASNPVIHTAEDLGSHNCFIYSYFQGKNIWPLDGGVEVNGNLRVNSTLFMLDAIQRDMGIGFIPDFVCRQALEQGDLIEILPQCERPALTLYALYPARHFVPAKLRVCIAFLEGWFREHYAYRSVLPLA